MRVGRWVVTTVDYIGKEGAEVRLTVIPSESLPERERARITEGRLEEFIKVLKRLKPNE